MLSLIVAVSSDGYIGKNGGLPWNYPEDLKYFKSKTLHHTIIMGRKTYESIGKPLPKRRNIVISGLLDENITGIHVVRSLGDALMSLSNNENAFIIGGAELYAAAIPSVNRIYWTEIPEAVSSGVMFPNINWSEWELFEEIKGETVVFKVFDRKEYI